MFQAKQENSKLIYLHKGGKERRKKALQQKKYGPLWKENSENCKSDDKYPAYTSDKVSHKTTFLKSRSIPWLSDTRIWHMNHDMLEIGYKWTEGWDQLKSPGFSQSLKTKLDNIDWVKSIITADMKINKKKDGRTKGGGGKRTYLLISSRWSSKSTMSFHFSDEI